MPSQKHFLELQKGVENWNKWWKERRLQDPDDRPELQGADLREMNLSQADLFEADLTGANLCGTNLHEADLNGAILRETLLDSKTVIEGKWRLVQRQD